MLVDLTHPRFLTLLKGSLSVTSQTMMAPSAPPAVTAGDRLETLPTRSVPNLQLDGIGLMLRPADLEFHTDGADVAFGAHVFHPRSCIFRTLNTSQPLALDCLQRVCLLGGTELNTLRTPWARRIHQPAARVRSSPGSCCLVATIRDHWNVSVTFISSASDFLKSFVFFTLLTLASCCLGANARDQSSLRPSVSVRCHNTRIPEHDSQSPVFASRSRLP